MPKIYDVAAVVGEKQDGKPRWMRCGSIIQRNDGKMALKLDAYPASGEGWFALFEPRQNQQPAPQPSTQTQGGGFNPDDDVPFAPIDWRTA